jgi:hypothetical protein
MLVISIVSGGLLATAVAAAQDAAPLALDKAAAFKLVGLKPGRWETKVAVESVRASPVEGGRPLPSGVQAEIEGRLTRQTTAEICIGTGLSPNGDMMLPGLQIVAACKLDQLDVREGAFMIRSSCAGGGVPPETGNVTFEATHSGDALQARSTMHDRNQAMEIEVKTTISSRYLGECRAN